MGLKGGWVSAVWGGRSRGWEQLSVATPAKLRKESASYSLENPLFPFVILFSLTPSSLCVCLSNLSRSLSSPHCPSLLSPPPGAQQSGSDDVCSLGPSPPPALHPDLLSSAVEYFLSSARASPRLASFSSLLFLSPHLSDLRLCHLFLAYRSLPSRVWNVAWSDAEHLGTSIVN